MNGFQEGFQNALIGTQYVTDQIAQGQERRKRNGLAALAQQAYNAPADQQRDLIGQAIGMDPQAGFALQKGLGDSRVAEVQSLGQAAQWFASLPPEAQASQYPQLVEQARRAGFPLPDHEFDPAQVQNIAKLGQAIAGKSPAGPMNVSPGGEIVDPTTGQVIHANTNFAPQRPTWDSARGGWVMPLDQQGSQGLPQSAPQDAQQAPQGDIGAVLDNIGQQFAFNVTDGFRTPQQNANTPGSAEHSLHMQNKARDYSIRGKSPEQIQSFLAALSANGFHAGVTNRGTAPHIHAEYRGGGGASGGGMAMGGGFVPVVAPRGPAPQRPAEFERKAAYLREHGVPEDQITQMVMGGSMQGAAPAPGDSTKTGAEYLATLPPQMRGLVKAIAEGQQAPPSASSRSPQAQALLQAVYAYDPSANASNLPARTQTRKDFTSGKSAQNLRSLNQAIGHLGLLHSQISGTAGHNFQLLNQIENAGARQFGSSGITNYEQTAAALAGELTQVFRGNSGAEADLVRNLQQLNSSQSEEQKRAAVTNIVGLLNSRIEELGQQYSQGMGKTTDPYSLLNKHALEVLKKVAPNVEVANLPPENGPQSGPKIIKYDAQGNRIP